MINKFIEFLKQIKCNHYKNTIPDRGESGTLEISINGNIPKEELEKFLVNIYMEGYEARRDEENEKRV